MKYLTADDIERLHLQIIEASGGSLGIRDKGRIESVVASQRQEVFGSVLYKTLFEKAAALIRGIIGDHPFVDGNKRTGTMSGLLLLELNELDMSGLSDQELEDFAVYVATKKPSIDEIAVWLEKHSAQA